MGDGCLDQERNLLYKYSFWKQIIFAMLNKKKKVPLFLQEKHTIKIGYTSYRPQEKCLSSSRIDEDFLGVQLPAANGNSAATCKNQGSSSCSHGPEHL
jgi:hypothetical protein